MTYTKRAFLSRLIGTAAAVPGLSLLGSGAARAADQKPPVVVELFTSQGCHSCPPAERILAELAQRDDVIALEFHVDYWDYIGWKDPFASPSYTARQTVYNQRLGSPYNYTPQMVIDGMAHAVGSRRGAVEARIEAAEMKRAMAKDAPPSIAIARVDSSTMSVSVDGVPAYEGRYDVVMVGFDGEHRTEVTRGENRGKELVNANVVRSMKLVVEDWPGGPVTKQVKMTAESGNSGCAVLIQDRDSGRIAAAAKLTW